MGKKSKGKASKEEASRPSKKIKVSEESESAESIEGQDEDEGPWECTRVIYESEKKNCRCDDCTNQATALWVSRKSGDQWGMCNECQIRDFGIIGQPSEKREVDSEDICTAANPSNSDTEILKAKQEEAEARSSEMEEKGSEDADETGSKHEDDSNTKEISDNSISRQPTPSPDALSTAPVVQENFVMKEETLGIQTPSGSSPVSSMNLEKEENGSSSPVPMSTAAASVISQTQDDEKRKKTDEETKNQGSDDEGQYDLKKILSFEDLSKSDTICCSKEECGFQPAFGLYVNSTDSKDRWFYCIDCQDDDFGGWPPLCDLPVKYLAPEHLRLMASKCSKKDNPAMPAFPSSLSPKACVKASTNSDKTRGAHVVTPPPGSFDLKGSTAVDSPMKSKRSKSSNQSASTAKGNPPLKNAKAIEIHNKWRQAAVSMGGKEARIVVSKSAAKKLIFDFMSDSFRPMNITQVYKGLKAVVPQPVLNTCLQEMIPDKFDGRNPFDDSDDEVGPLEEKKELSTDPYSDSLVFKPGKNLGTNLYHVDYTKIKGLDRDEREALVRDIASTDQYEGELQAKLKVTRETTAGLLAEPTNEELTLKLQSEETNIQDLERQLEEARKLKVNEKHRQKTKRRIHQMSSYWRQRRRLCLDFLTSLEENTDGMISRSKCLKGDGPIALDSDEFVAAAAVAYAKEKEKRSTHGGKKGTVTSRKKSIMGHSLNCRRDFQDNSGLATSLDSNLVAVTLDSQLNVTRVYANFI